MTRERTRRLEALLRAGAAGERVADGLCRVSVDVLTVTGAGITLVTPSGALAPVAVTDEVTSRLYDAQQVLGEGPSLEAFHSGGPVLEADVRTADARWPAFTREAGRHGVRAVFSFPLHVGVYRLGSLDTHRDVAESLSRDQLTDALLLADAATQMLIDLGQDGASTSGLAALDGHALWRPEVHQATGRLMVQLDVDVAEAFVRLRAHAFAAGRTVTDVAADIAAGTLRLDQDDDTRGAG